MKASLFIFALVSIIAVGVYQVNDYVQENYTNSSGKSVEQLLADAEARHTIPQKPHRAIPPKKITMSPNEIAEIIHEGGFVCDIPFEVAPRPNGYMVFCDDGAGTPMYHYWVGYFAETNLWYVEFRHFYPRG